MKRLLFLTFALSLSLNIFAQLEVKNDSFKEVPGFVNMNPDENFRTDDNELPFAVIKVRTENITDKQRHDLIFEGNSGTFIMLEYKTGEVWVYLTAKYADYLKISHPDFSSIEYHLPFGLQPNKGYEMTLVNKAAIDKEIMARLERYENALASRENDLSIQEPEFIGTVMAIINDSTYLPTTKEYGELKYGTSWKYNSWNATSLCLSGNSSKCKLKSGSNKFIVKVTNNNNDPNSILTIFRFDKKSHKRTAVLSLDNRGTLMASKTISDYKVLFDAVKYGESSFIIQANLKPGEYGIIVTQPNGAIGNHPVINCFTVLR